MSHFLNFGFCVPCDKTRDLNQQGRCANCDSEAIVRRKAHEAPQQSVIEELMSLE